MRRRILLADDSVTIQKVIELTFMDEDYDVKAVSNGDEALAALPDVQPDVVIADVHMPGANGYEVCRRSKESRPEVPVLLLVGTFEPFDEGQARAAGADSFLKKPFDSQELLQRVQDLLASRPGAAAPAAPAAPELDLSASLPPLDFSPAGFDAPPAFAPAAAEPDWGAFQLEPEPAPDAYLPLSSSEPFPAAAPEPERPASPFLEEETPFVLEDDRAAPAFQVDSFQIEESAVLPAGEALFDLDNSTLDSPALDSPLREEPALSNIDFAEAAPPRPVAGFASPWRDEEPAPEERLGVPESAVPLVDSLAETEARIEAPPPASFAAAHEPAADELPAWAPAAAPEPEPPVWSPPPAAAAPVAVEPGEHSGNGRLSDEDVDRIARRVVELMGDKAVRDIAWEVIPDLAEVVIRGRLRELEAQVENPAE
jgi:CheY-like chemotaxis protein